MTGSKIQSFDLFKAAMGNSEYLKEISQDIRSHTQFLTTLEESQLTALDILESIKIVQSLEVKSLLIIHLLSQKEFLSCLRGDSLLNRLTHQDHHVPSRLNMFIHQLDLTILSAQLIEKLEPEAAISLLCSVPHFHQLSKTQIEALIERYPLYERHRVLTYWLNHFSSMPNAQYVLAHLMHIAGPNVIDELCKMESNQKEAIIINIIEHLGLFNKIPLKFLEHANKESHLILAMRLYLNGHYNKAYASYINQLTKILLDKNHSFSLEAIELLFYLNDKLAFKELAKSTAFLTNRYLRNNALKGNVALFYQNKRINTQRLLQTVYLNPISETSKERKQSSDSDENPFIQGLIKHDKSINCFEYFLIHYKGDPEPFSKLINDYMDFYAGSEHLKSRNQAIHHIGFMLSRPELDPIIKEILFTAFLNHPLFFDEQVSYQLFLFDAKRVLRYFGLRGGEENYQHVINLCTLALKNLNSEKNPQIIQIAQQALSEARQELIWIKHQGFFATLIKWLKRCWTYGWTGFFKPNSPDYVVPESLSFIQNNKNVPKNSEKKTVSPPESAKDLPTLLNKIRLPLTQEKFAGIIKAFESYSLEIMPKDELSTRQKLHKLYHYVMTHKEHNEGLYRWLKENQTPFSVNRFHLLELTLKEKQREEVDSLLAEVNEDSDHLQYVSDELDCPMPELIIKPTPKPKTQETSDFVASASKVFSEYACEATVYAHSAFHWAESFFSKMKQPEQEEDDTFEVEHIESFKKTISSS